MTKYFDKKNITCLKCQVVKTTSDFYYNKARHTYSSTCKICNTKKCIDYQKSKLIDINFITQRRASEIRRRVKNSNKQVPVASDLKDILREQWETQKGICYYTGEKMILSNEYHTNDYVMTVDKIIPENGYVKGNVVLCCSIANRMKQNLSIDELKRLCEKILSWLDR